ncbi:MAG: DsbA family oxidoreductase [Actinomycetota bacterium]|nr:DsbA family oxidoreductase [Actinomycetota bacterium]
MLIDVYADVVCPWCYIGERRLEKAIAERPDLEVERRWRPFQLQPSMPEGGLPWAEFARQKFGGEDLAQAAFAHVTTVGAEEGIRFDFDRVASAPNTVDAHRLILLASKHDRQWETADALFNAYFAEGRDLNDHDELAAIVARVELDAEEVRSYLAGEEGVAEVRRSQKEAHILGIHGVPCYVVDDRYAISGAQPVEVFLRVFDQLGAGRVT